MLEDMLAYQPANLLRQRFSEFLAADLDDDAQRFYARMAADIAAVAAGAGLSLHPTGVVQTLLEALAAAPAARAACWRRLYRQIIVLVAGRANNDTFDDGKSGPALARLRQFLNENGDLAGPPAFETFGRLVFGSSAGA